MTPKEKAIELVDRFHWKGDVERMSLDNSKQSALICLNQMKEDSLAYGDANAEDFLNEVEQEINKL